MQALQERAGASFALVSPDAPLISNLDTWINITLVKLYRENIKKAEAKETAMAALKRLNLQELALFRPADLVDRTLFAVKLLRACMVARACLVIERPFALLPAESDLHFLRQQLELVQDLFHECQVLDFSHFQNRYQDAFPQ